MKSKSDVVYMLYSPDIVWDWTTNKYPAHDDKAFKWTPNFIPVKKLVNGKVELYHVWLKMKVGENDDWTNPIRLSSSITKGDTGIQGVKGDKGDKGDIGVKSSIVVQYADSGKQLINSSSPQVRYFRFIIDTTNISDWLPLSQVIDNGANIAPGINGQVFTTDGMNNFWADAVVRYTDAEAVIATIDDTATELMPSSVKGYTSQKIWDILNVERNHVHDTRYYTELEIDNLLLSFYSKAQLDGGSLNPIYYTKAEVASALSLKEDNIIKNTAFNKDFGITVGSVSEGNHIHDDRYYTEAEINTILSGTVKYTDLSTPNSGTSVDWTNLVNVDLSAAATAITGNSPISVAGTVISHLSTPGNRHLPAGGSVNNLLSIDVSGNHVWRAETQYLPKTLAPNNYWVGDASGNAVQLPIPTATQIAGYSTLVGGISVITGAPIKATSKVIVTPLGTGTLTGVIRANVINNQITFKSVDAFNVVQTADNVDFSYVIYY